MKEPVESQIIGSIVDEVNNVRDRTFEASLQDLNFRTNIKIENQSESLEEALGYVENVKEFLKNLSTNKKYPFSTPELREELKHTFWYVGNRVESVKALEQLLKKDAVFKEYEIIVAAGDGRSFEDEENA